MNAEKSSHHSDLSTATSTASRAKLLLKLDAVETDHAMQTRSDEGLYEALETELRKAKEPLDCVDLFDKASVRAHATTVNRVSDYLGNLWRKGKLTRLPAPPNEGRKARWLYVWKGRPKTPRPTIEEARQYNRVILKRPNIEISEEGDTITIELPQFTLTFKPRPQ